MSPQPISRRSVTSGLAWSIPVVAGVAAAPAFAVSPGQCGTIVWTSTSLSGSTRTGVFTTQQGEKITVTVTSVMNSGQAVAGYNFQAAASGAQQALVGGGEIERQGYWYNVQDGRTTSVLTLDQRTGATSTARGSQTLTFSFKDSTGKTVTPSTMTFDIYDVTNSTYNNTYRYTDRLTANNGTLTLNSSGGVVRGGVPARYTGTTNSIASDHSVSQNSSDVYPGNWANVTVSPTAGAQNIQLTYDNAATLGLAAYNNYQYIGLGDMRFCF